MADPGEEGRSSPPSQPPPQRSEDIPPLPRPYTFGSPDPLIQPVSQNVRSADAGVATGSGPATPSQAATPARAADDVAGSRTITPRTGILDLGSLTSADAARARARERPVDEMLNDPLREVTRKERRSLLGISAIALLIGWTHGRVLPSRIDNFGITELTTPDRGVLLWLFLLIVGYYFVAFVLYAWTDSLKYFHTVREGAKTLSKQRDEQVIGSLRIAAESPWWLRLVAPASLMRGVFDFFVPLAVALFAMGSLWGAVHQVATTTRPQPPAASAPATPAVAPAVPHGDSFIPDPKK
jgi:hypothetical protein